MPRVYHFTQSENRSLAYGFLLEGSLKASRDKKQVLFGVKSMKIELELDVIKQAKERLENLLYEYFEDHKIDWWTYESLLKEIPELFDKDKTNDN